MRIIWEPLNTEPYENSAIVSIPFWRWIGNHLVLSGKSGAQFQISILRNGQRIEGNIYFYTDAEGILCYFGAIEALEDDKITLSFPDTDEQQQISMPFPSSTLGQSDMNAHIPAQGLWDALATLTPLSPDWHLALSLISKDKILGMSNENRTLLEREIIRNLKLIISDFDPAGWQGSVDGFDSARITGWAKRSNSSTPAKIVISINGVPIREDFECSTYREDLRLAGIGSGRFSFNLLLDKHSFDSDVLAVTLSDPVSSKVFAYKIFTYNYCQLNYALILEGCNPDFKGYCYSLDWRERPLELKLYIDDVFYTSCWNKKWIEYIDQDTSARLKGHVGFSTQSPGNLLHPGEHSLRIEMHGARFSREVKFNTGYNLPVPINSLEPLGRRISIIIPWYNDACLDECLNCIMRYTPQNIRIFIINDCSTLPERNEILARAAANPLVTVLENHQNMGFSATVNRGLAAAAPDDVVILNQDAMVTPGWLRSMLLTAASAPRVATVTPMSDKAGAFSAPEMGNDNPLPRGASEEAFSRAFRRASFGLRPLVPTGNGFCMYISRACINEIGGLDAERYASLYGEENDFCMRALRAGWLHLVDDSTYVFHRRPHSFTEARQGLMDQAALLLAERYPEYRQAAKVFGNGKDFFLARFAGRIAARNWLQLSRPRILYAISVEGGGTPHTNLDLMGEMAHNAQCYLLTCNKRWMQLKEYKDGNFEILYTYKLNQQIEPVSHISPEYDAVIAGWLDKLDIDILHIRLILCIPLI